MSRPIVLRSVDLETTGMAPPEHTVCQIGWCDLQDGEVQPPKGTFVNPCRPIPPESSAVHHIIDDDVQNAPEWNEAVKWMIGDEPITAFVAHNARFEQAWITPELTGGIPFICTYKCALRLWPDAPSHSNQALRYWRKPAALDRAIASVAHRAPEDAYVTAFLVRDMLSEATLEQMIAWSWEPALLINVRFGKHAGKKWSEVAESAPDYLEWMLRQDFDEDVKFTARHWLAQRQKPGATA